MLPVETCWPELSKTINQQDVILVAPPGAGKSTFLPLKLLTLPIFAKQKIIMLQPRQIAVRSIAQYLAQQLGEPVGQTIGYRMRGDVQVSRNTRLEIVTEGLLTRFIQSDPELNNVGLVIFDEFHERNLHADFSLALCLDSQQALRSDLRLLIMSATLDVGPIASLIPAANVIESAGQSYPVTCHYFPTPSSKNLENHVFSVILEVISKHIGDVLVFLPGAREISQVASLCNAKLPSNVHVVPLFGALTKEKQSIAVKPSTAGQRKIVLATNIAETSLTIDGIKVVIDSGQEKVASFNWQRKLPQLISTQISKASAVQRAGRAGRVSTGDCYRLWSQEVQQRLVAQQIPAFLLVDVTDFYLEAKLWGSELEDLALLDKPKKAQLEYAQNTLTWLNALDGSDKLTARGRQLHGFGCHPRLANMLLDGKNTDDGTAQLACLTCALLEYKPIKEMTNTVWLSEHITFLLANPQHGVWHEAKRWAKKLHVSLDNRQIRSALKNIDKLLLAAFPDYVARARSAQSYQLVNGTGAKLPISESLVNADQTSWLIVPKLTLQKQVDAIIRLAHPINEEQVLATFSSKVSQVQETSWSTSLRRVVSREITKFGAIIVESKTLPSPNKNASVEVIVSQIQQTGLSMLDWAEDGEQFLRRARLAKQVFRNEWPDFSETTLLEELNIWLAPFLVGITGLQQLQKLNWVQILSSRLSWQQQQQLNAEFPTSLEVATGQLCKLSYRQDGTVELQAKIQQFYGWQATPCIANGKLPVSLTLLSPAGRPLQKTMDLASFWNTSYVEVKKEMKGRYPKHFWPDDPANAKATNKTRKHMS